MEALLVRLLALLNNVAWAKRNCRHCDRPLWLVRVNGGYSVAYTSEGRNHLEDCPRYTQPLQEALIWR